MYHIDRYTIDVYKRQGQSYEEVRNSDLYTLEVESQEFNNQYPAGVIFEQTPTSGKRVKEGITIQVKVSTGSQTITLPDFKDQEAALVYAKLTELGDRKSVV